jgi:uncharacterized lipoprotein YbaY
VVKIAATYEDNPVTAAQKRLMRIALSAALSVSGTFVFITNHDTDRGWSANRHRFYGDEP